MRSILYVLLPLCLTISHQTECNIPEPGLPHDYVYDLSLKPKLGWGVEWWYYVLNLNADMEYYPSITITTFALRTPLDSNCSSPNNQLFQLYIGIVSPIFDEIEYEYSTILNLDDYESNNDLYLNITTEHVSFVRNPYTNYTWIRFGNNQLMFQDGRGYYLQGEGGFTKVGPETDDNYYAGSFMRLKANGLLENGILMNGVGYGEHVFGSPNDTSPIISPYKGWHCHYIHNSPCMQPKNNLKHELNPRNHTINPRKNKDLQYCMSVKKDGSMDEYAHGIYVNENNEIFVLNATDIQFNYSNVWDTYFDLRWTYFFVNPNINIPEITMFPIQNQVNQTHTFDNTTWWDGGVTTVNEGYYGVLELVHF